MISTIQVALNTLRALDSVDKAALIRTLKLHTFKRDTMNKAIEALIVLVEDQRTLARYPYSGEAQRSEAVNDARRDAEARKRNGENVQYRHIDDDTGTAYVVERLG
jgi:hypothetical protein